MDIKFDEQGRRERDGRYDWLFQYLGRRFGVTVDILQYYLSPQTNGNGRYPVYDPEEFSIEDYLLAYEVGTIEVVKSWTEKVIACRHKEEMTSGTSRKKFTYEEIFDGVVWASDILKEFQYLNFEDPKIYVAIHPGHLDYRDKDNTRVLAYIRELSCAIQDSFQYHNLNSPLDKQSEAVEAVIAEIKSIRACDDGLLPRQREKLDMIVIDRILREIIRGMLPSFNGC